MLKNLLTLLWQQKRQSLITKSIPKRKAVHIYKNLLLYGGKIIKKTYPGNPVRLDEKWLIRQNKFSSPNYFGNDYGRVH